MLAEIPVVKGYAKGSVLDVGAGVGRALSMLDPERVTEYYGVEPNKDYASDFIDEAIAAQNNGLKVVCMSPHTFEDSFDLFKNKKFDTSLVLWNTLSTGWCGKEQNLLEPLSYITKSALFTVIAPGNLNTRLNYYINQNIEIDKVDPTIDLIVSDQWEQNRAYSFEQLHSLLMENWSVTSSGTMTTYVNYVIAESKKFD